MGEIFLSASVPAIGRGTYHETADPFLIQCAVREFVISTIHKHTIVWGGHPAITPMIWNICEDLGVKYSKSVILYQSRLFKDAFPEENAHFQNVIFTDAAPSGRAESLRIMREQMLSRQDLIAGVFIGGMEGLEEEYELFVGHHPRAKVITVPSPGGAALNLSKRIGQYSDGASNNIDYAAFFHSKLKEIDEEIGGRLRSR